MNRCKELLPYPIYIRLELDEGVECTHNLEDLVNSRELNILGKLGNCSEYAILSIREKTGT